MKDYRNYSVRMVVSLYSLLTAQELAGRLQFGFVDEFGNYRTIENDLWDLKVSRWSVEKDNEATVQDETDEFEMVAYLFETELSFQSFLPKADFDNQLTVCFGKEVSAEGLTNEAGEIIAEICDYLEWKVETDEF